MIKIIKKIIPKVSKRILLFEAALVWGFAGSKILIIGINDLVNNSKWYWINILIGLIGFYFFFKLVFYKMYKKHTKRIINYEQDKKFFLSFFDVKGFCIMAFMITFGITLKEINIIPILYMATFYISLGTSLFSAAISFFYSGLRYEYMKSIYYIENEEVLEIVEEVKEEEKNLHETLCIEE